MTRDECNALADAEPKWSENNIPFCNEDGCKQYDGKRCRLLGVRPGYICEPAVSVLAAEVIK